MIDHVSLRTLRKRRSVFILFLSIFVLAVQFSPAFVTNNDVGIYDSEVLSEDIVGSEQAIATLETLSVKGRAPKTGYSRSEFGSGWAEIDGCDVRNLVLQRDLTNLGLGSSGCIVLNGTLIDPYTGSPIHFQRGSKSSNEVQIDHVVALSDSWQKGAQLINQQERLRFANDSLNLLAVDGPANQKKGDSDAASWLPANKSYRCRYVARQIAVKRKYRLWVTSAEKSTMKRVLNTCPNQPLPVEDYVEE